MSDLASAILGASKDLGVSPVDLGTAISYETAGTFDPWKAGPTTQWGQHRGLIQWGEPQRQQYGVHQGMPVAEQMAAVERYLRDKGVQPGMGLMDIYSAINAGHVGRYGASDAANGGAPGTVADKVTNQMAAHRQNAQQLLGGADVPPEATPAPAPAAPIARPIDVTQFAAPAAPTTPDAIFAALSAQQPLAPQPATPAAPAGPLAGLTSLASLFSGPAQPVPPQPAAEDIRQARRRALLGGAPDPFTKAVMG